MDTMCAMEAVYAKSKSRKGQHGKVKDTAD